MNAISSVKELNRVVRDQLIELSGLPSDRVLNSLSLHGTDLDKLLEDNIYNGYATSDSVLLFELESRQNRGDMSQSNDDDTISLYRSFVMRLIIYGDDSSDVANIVISRLRTQYYLNTLRDNGVYVEDVEEPTIVNEYKNDTMWIRNDINVDISSKFIIQPANAYVSFEDYVGINIVDKANVISNTFDSAIFDSSTFS